MDAIDRITPPLAPGERVVVRHRLEDSSATDVIGWVSAIEFDTLRLVLKDDTEAAVRRGQIIVAKRVPGVSRGRDPLAEDPVRLQRLAVSGWVDHQEPLGEWILRSGGGFTGRANSCLAIGDPGQRIADAADKIIAFCQAHQIPPLAQVIDPSPEQAALRAVGWQPAYRTTDILVQRLVDLIGPDPQPITEVTIIESITDEWMEAYHRSRPNGADEATLRRVLTGRGPAGFASITVDRHIVAIGKAHTCEDWMGVASLWTDQDHRGRRMMTKIISELGRWGARHGARSVYLQVEVANEAAHAAYAKLGFQPHHVYGYLAPPESTD